MGAAGMPGPKKAAHYSVPVPGGTPGGVRPGRPRPRTQGGAWARGALLLAGALALVIWVSPSPGAPAGRPEADARKAEAELQSVKAEIERITREVSAEQVERDQLTTELKGAELSVGKVRAALAEVRRERAERAARRAGLAAEKHQREGEVREKRAALAGRLHSQQAGLEKLLRELRAAVERFPIEGNDVFARLRGRLAWPVSGRVLARFGDARAGGVRWDGVLVATERGAPVKAVCQGRVIYADWLPGLGLLTIVDHGDGYLSLYGHNERLYKAAGEPVATGDTIAAAGDSGGSSRPELYFEIRKGGRPVDPRPWFKAPDP